MPQEINQFNLNAGIINKYHNILHYNTFWHQVVVENVEGLDRDSVLRTLTKFCQPLHFIPVHYKVTNNAATFLLKNCGAAIQKFCAHNLIVINPHNSDKPFKITIKLCYASSNDLKINIHINLSSVLNKRFNEETAVLNLDNFAKDPDLEEYCALSQPKLFFYIMHLAKSIQFKVLKLTNNDIEFLQSMEGLEGVKTAINVDLRNNNIKDVAELSHMKHLNVVELWLDGNPVCDNFNEITYGKAVRDKLEKLEKLDGINVQFKGFLPFRRNFLCDLSGFDLVDQFLEHYFMLYDAQNRSLLQELYNKDAFFSLTGMFIPGQTTSSTAKLSEYKKVSRNLKHISDFSKSTQYLCMGPQQISRMLSSLPPSEHDPFSFAADLIMHTETTAVLVVSGVFRESSNSLLESDRLLGFSRTFVLLAGPKSEYSIINEMLSVTNATNVQSLRAFKQNRIPKPKKINIPRPQNEKERSEMIHGLTVITGLKSEWSEKCLEECHFEFKDALSLFVELVKKDTIPRTAFLSDQEKRDLVVRLKNIAATPVVSLSSNPKLLGLSRENSQQRLAELAVGVVQPMMKRKSKTPFPKKTSFTQGPSSPDQVWNKYSSSDNGISKNEYSTEVIDIVSSSDDEMRNMSTDQDMQCSSAGIDQRSEQIPITSNVVPSDFQSEPEISAAKRMDRKSQKKTFYPAFQAFQTSYQKGGLATSMKKGLAFIERHCFELEVFEVVFDFLYQTNLSDAREFKLAVYEMSDRKTPFLNSLQLDLIIARCEYLYGDEADGEKAFRRLMTVRSSWAKPITEFCKALLLKNKVIEAKMLIHPLIINDKHSLSRKMARIAKQIEKEMKVNLLW